MGEKLRLPAETSQVVGPSVRLDRLLVTAEWSALLAALALWIALDTYSTWKIVGVSLLVGSCAARWIRRGRLTRPTTLDLPLFLFFISAVLGLWAAPDRAAGLARLYLLLGAVGLYYALVNAEAESLVSFSGELVGLAAVLSLYFVSQHDWTAHPPKFEAIRDLGLRINSLVPDLGWVDPDPRQVAALLSITAPVAVVGCLEAAKEIRTAIVKAIEPPALAWLGLAMDGLSGAAVLSALVMTESRAAWLALFGAGGLALWWWATGEIEEQFRFSQQRIFWIGVGTVAAVWTIGVLIWPQVLTLVFGALPGPASTVSRADFYAQLWRLAGDKPFTGGGLAAFAALYSTHVLVIPFAFLSQAHNAYFHVLIEQGWLGLAGYVAILAVAVLAAVRVLWRGDTPMRPLATAGALGLATIVLQGFGDASLVAGSGIAALLIPAGVALAEAASGDVEKTMAASWNARRIPIAAGSLLILAGVPAVLAVRPLLAAWHANLGAVAHDRIELSGWPRGEWDDGSNAALLGQAEPALQKAIALDASNRTALHRLGSAAMLGRDFPRAIRYLQRAYDSDPRHRGITKALGYGYVWLGESDRAAPLLARIPEARDELEVYAWWWGTQGRKDLAERARHMVGLLGG